MWILLLHGPGNLIPWRVLCRFPNCLLPSTRGLNQVLQLFEFIYLTHPECFPFPLPSFLKRLVNSFGRYLPAAEPTKSGFSPCLLEFVELHLSQPLPEKIWVQKYSKHCRVCDKCVDSFDHHCRWLNNCIGKRNYRRFFILMISALLMLILQWSIGVVVLILSFLERKRFSTEIGTKLGSSFSLVPFIIVVGSCTIIAMIATLPLTQLFFFHVLLIKKGISTYDYIVALREQEQEQEQQGVGQQSPQMSSVSSLTGLSSASSFSAFRRDAWCTLPRLFLEDQFDVVPPEVNMSFKNTGKKMMPEESTRKRSGGPVKISPWTLARLDAEEVSRAAAEAKKKSNLDL